MNWKERMVYILAVSLLLVTAAAAADRREFTVPVGADGIQRVEVVGGSYFFDPDYVIVKNGLPVEMKIRKETGLAPHDFVLKAPEAGIDVTKELTSEPIIVTFTPAKPGRYRFYCSKKGLFGASHKERGMEGILDVKE